MEHKIINKLHIITVGKRVNVFTEKEYEYLTWWQMVKLKYNL
jgi:hypothetical protein